MKGNKIFAIIIFLFLSLLIIVLFIFTTTNRIKEADFDNFEINTNENFNDAINDIVNQNNEILSDFREVLQKNSAEIEE